LIVTPDFKGKIKCLMYVCPRSSFTHTDIKVTIE
jgi:hypothetical protein